MRRLDLTGKRFHRWTVLAYAETRDQRAYWRCCCDCGTEKIINGANLLRGLSQSCGCWRAEVSIQNGRSRKGSDGNRGATRQHGEAINRTPEYRTWLSMHERCRSPQSQKWINYGGRGIRVCERWNSYENFLSDMGRRPSPVHSLDRIDNDGNYEPSNCRWATKKQQVDNRRTFGRIEKFTDEQLQKELNRRSLMSSIDGILGSLA